MISFKIMQADAAAIGYLGWAKSQVNKLISAGVENFTRTWTFNDAQVVARSASYESFDAREAEDDILDNKIVRLWFTSDIATYFYEMLVSSPCKCRTVYIYVLNVFPSPMPTPPVFKPLVMPPASFSSSPGPTYFTPEPGSSCFDGCSTIVVSVSNGPPPDEGASPPPSSHSLWSGSYTHVQVPPGGSSDVNVSGAWNDFQSAYDANIEMYNNAYADYLKASQPKKTGYVVLSDGSVLVTWPVTSDVVTTVWSGGGYVDLADGSQIAFTVPDDVCIPAFAQNETDKKLIATHKAALIRERKRVKNCSDAFIKSLEAKIVSGLLPFVRQNRLYSGFVSMPTLMDVKVTDTQSGSGDNILYTKKVELSFVDDTGVIHVTTITGTKHVVITHCANSHGTPNAASIITATYSSWLPINSNGASGIPVVEPVLFDYVFILDGATNSGPFGIFEACAIWDGVKISGAGDILGTLDSFGAPFVPPVPIYSDSRTISYPQIYRDYRATFARKYNAKQQTAQTAWLDSLFINGEEIDVIPLSVLHADFGDLGVFPQAADLLDTTKLSFVFSRLFTYRYTYLTGSFSLVRFSRVAKDGKIVKDDGTDVTLSLPYKSGVNFVVRSRGKQWDDVRSKYIVQQKRLRSVALPAPVPPLTSAEKLFQQVNTAYAQFQAQPLG